VEQLKQSVDDKLDAFTELSEGFSSRVYKCPANHNTCGFGYNLDANPLSLSKDEIQGIYRRGITKARARELMDLEQGRLISIIERHVGELDEYPENVQIVLVDMAYNLGPVGLFNFRKMISAIRAGEYPEASEEMKDSLWYRQVKTRAKSLVNMMREAKK
jgi:lysozyme